MSRALALAIVTCFAPVAGAVPLLTGFGGPTGYGIPTHCLHASDNGSYAGAQPGTAATPVPVDIRQAFPNGLRWFGRHYDGFYVNANGNITFAAPLSSPNPVAYPVAGQPMIAPWWADVDTSRGGQPSDNAICYHIEPNRLVVTWHNVQRHGASDGLRNDFQLILSTSGTCTTGGDFDVEFRYNRCEWAAGEGVEGMPGTPAQVGFDAGNRRNFVTLPMSRSAAITAVCSTSNVPGGEPGLYRFQIRGGGGWGPGCSGSGTPCAVPGQHGICAQGVTTCVGLGTTCTQITRPRARRCNGLDNDCDGHIDEGDGLCPGAQVCDQGLCRDRCAQGAGCATGRVCSPRGTCVEAACLDVACPQGARCQRGECVDACDGVTCPRGQRCRTGRCVDPCEGVVCNAAEVCEDHAELPTAGQCVAGCQCHPCGAGLRCLTDGRCVDEDCLDVTCPEGSRCERGECVDRCASPSGARLCLEDEVCRGGRCVSARDATPDDAGRAILDGGTMSPMALDPSGCGCGVGGARSWPIGSALWGLGWVLATRRRRRSVG